MFAGKISLFYGKAWLTDHCQKSSSIKSPIHIVDISATLITSSALWFFNSDQFFEKPQHFLAVTLIAGVMPNLLYFHVDPHIHKCKKETTKKPLYDFIGNIFTLQRNIMQSTRNFFKTVIQTLTNVHKIQCN